MEYTGLRTAASQRTLRRQDGKKLSVSIATACYMYMYVYWRDCLLRLGDDILWQWKTIKPNGYQPTRVNCYHGWWFEQLTQEGDAYLVKRCDAVILRTGRLV